MDAATSASFISTREALSAIRGGRPPLIIDVRREQAFRAANDMIAGALWRDPERVTEWRASCRAQAASSLTACTARGQPGCRKALGDQASAAGAEGGIEEGWKAAGGGADRKAAGANTRWVTRERPKIDRIAMPVARRATLSSIPERSSCTFRRRRCSPRRRSGRDALRRPRRFTFRTKASLQARGS